MENVFYSLSITTNSMAKRKLSRSRFHHFLLCSTSISMHRSNSFYFNIWNFLFEVISTKITSQNTRLNMQRANKTEVEDSLCQTFHPKCFRTTNFDRFRQAVSFQYAAAKFQKRQCLWVVSTCESRPLINSCSSPPRQALHAEWTPEQASCLKVGWFTGYFMKRV